MAHRPAKQYRWKASKNKKRKIAKVKPLIQIFTTCPIPTIDLKRKFKENIEFVIDCRNSKYKGKVLITYLSNLGIKCRLNLEDPVESLELVLAYMKYPKVASIPDLEQIVLNIMLAAQGKPHLLSFNPTQFILDNVDIVDVWMKRLCSLPLFALYSKVDKVVPIHIPADPENDIDEDNTKVELTRSFDVTKYPLDDNSSLPGLNFVQLIKHVQFAELMVGIDERYWTYNPDMFDRYIFSAKNLFHYFAIASNPLFIATLMDDEELKQLEVEAKAEIERLDQISESLNVPLIR